VSEMSEEFSLEFLKRSKKQIGPIYPILKAPDGTIIDGRHRAKADPDWPSITLDWLKSPVEVEMIRLIAHIRREMPAKEKSECLAKLIEMTGWKPKELAENLGVSYRWVMKYLPDRYKDERMKALAARCAAKEKSLVKYPPEKLSKLDKVQLHHESLIGELRERARDELCLECIRFIFERLKKEEKELYG